MTRPLHAHETENGRYYNVPGIDDPLVSVTNAISVGLSKHGLPLWYANLATEAAWDYVPQMVSSILVEPCGITPRWDDRDGEQPCDRCRPCLTRHIKAAAERARDSAAFLGSRVHDLADAHVTGKQLAEEDGDREAGLYVDQYLKFLKDFGIELERDVIASETTIVAEKAGYAGTGDLWVRLPFAGFLWKKKRDGSLVVDVVPAERPQDRALILIDLKTSRTRSSTQSFPHNVMQLAALSHAPQMLMPDGELVPNLNVRGAATLQLRAKTYRLIPLPARTHEYHLFTRVLHLAKWLHNEWPGDYGHRPITPSGRIVPKRGQKET